MAISIPFFSHVSLRGLAPPQQKSSPNLVNTPARPGDLVTMSQTFMLAISSLFSIFGPQTVRGLGLEYWKGGVCQRRPIPSIHPYGFPMVYVLGDMFGLVFPAINNSLNHIEREL